MSRVFERDDLKKLNIPASGKAYARQTRASLRPGRRPDMYFRMVRDLTKGPEKGFPTPDVGKDTAGKAGAGALHGGAKGPTLGHSKTVAQRAGRAMVDSLARRLVGELLEDFPRHFEVVVGNIGTVYSGRDEAEAQKHYDEYVDQSKTGYGRAAGESVTMFRNGEIFKEHIGTQEDAHAEGG